MTTTVLQGNMNGSRLAHQLLPRIAEELRADVLLLSEPLKRVHRTTWLTSDSGYAALWVRGDSATRVSKQGRGADFVWAKIADVTYISVYLSPNCSAAEFERKLAALEDAVREITGTIILAGDVNARAIEWGMPATNKRGRLLLEMTARLDLVLANVGRVTTYRRPGVGESIPDVTFVSNTILRGVERWRVFDGYTASDHQYIVFGLSARARTAGRLAPPVGWNVRKLDAEKMSAQLNREMDPELTVSARYVGKERCERIAAETAKLLTRACNASMPRKRARRDKDPVYWWTEEIAELRRACLRLRRKAQRARTQTGALPRCEEYRGARRALRRAINETKSRRWSELIAGVDADPWGAGYRIVTRDLGVGGPPVVRDEETADRIVGGLFPTHPEQVWEEDRVTVGEVPAISPEELASAISSMATGKAPGPDGIPAEILRTAAAQRPEIFLTLYNACLLEGSFPKEWKTARLILIRKKKDGYPDSPSSYRPLSLLNTLGKLFELLLRPRIQEAIQAAGGLSDRQHGFRKGRSTIGAIRSVIEYFDKAQLKPHKDRPIVLLATLDVKNAFNSARWVDIVGVLQNTFALPPYLVRVVKDYLRDRQVAYATESGTKTRKITAGVAQGSILGPDLWNAIYDGLLRLPMPPGVRLIAYADDVVIVIVAGSVCLAQQKLSRAMTHVTGWMRGRGLELAVQKTELLFLTRRRIDLTIPMTVETTQMRAGGEAKYLGVTLDTKLSFWPHIKRVTETAARKTAALARLMANTKGPRPSVRRLLMAVTHSILLYGAEIWGGAMRVKKYSKSMLAVQRRGALRIACAYRTVSADAVLVIAGVIPVDLLALERKRVYETSNEIGRARAASAERDTTLAEWQARWDGCEQSRWTRRLIVDLRSWTGRGFGEVNFYLTQFLSGHGYFRRYLYRMGRLTDPICRYCGHDGDDAEHTFFVCPRWATERHGLEVELGELTPDNVVSVMLKEKNNWDRISRFVTTVLRKKKDDGCLED